MEEDFDFFDGLLEENHTTANSQATSPGNSNSSNQAVLASPNASTSSSSASSSRPSSSLTDLPSPLFSSPPTTATSSVSLLLLGGSATATTTQCMRAGEERFNELVDYDQVGNNNRRHEIIPLAKSSLVVQFRDRPDSLYVTRKAVFIPTSGKYFQSPNVRHLCCARISKSSEAMACAASLVVLAQEQEQRAQLRARRKRAHPSSLLLDQALENTLKIVYNDKN